MGVITIVITGVVLFFKTPDHGAPIVYFPNGSKAFVSAVDAKIANVGHAAYVKVREGDIDRANTTLRPWIAIKVRGRRYVMFALDAGRDYVISVTPPTRSRAMGYANSPGPRGVSDPFESVVRADYIKENALLKTGKRLLQVTLPAGDVYAGRADPALKWTLNNASNESHSWGRPLAQAIVGDIPTSDNKLVLSEANGAPLLTLKRRWGGKLSDVEIGYSPIGEMVGACDRDFDNEGEIPGCEEHTTDYHPQVLGTSGLLDNWGDGRGYPWWVISAMPRHTKPGHTRHLGGANCPPVLFEPKTVER